jgi:DNA mismatch repair ATPase MutS
LIEYFNENQKIKNIFLEELKRLPDLEKIFYVFYRVESGKKHKCEVSDLIKLYRVIQCISDLVKNLEGEGVEG